MTKNKEFSPERKMTFYIGSFLTLIGVVMFLSVFFSGFSQSSKPSWSNPGPKPKIGWKYPQTKPRHKPKHGHNKVVLIGFALMLIGTLLTKLGRNGIAGSGLVLNAEQERKDLEPISRIIGGRINDALEEVNLKGKISEGKEIIKIRCLKCENLNDEEDNFCGKCGRKV